MVAVSGKLIARCTQGDRDAFQELFQATHRDVHRILYRLAGPDLEMEDLVQQVYFQLFRSIRKFRGESAFSTYLFGICLRVAKKRARAAGRLARLRAALAGEPRRPTEAPENRIQRLQRAEEVHRTLSRMSFKLRTVLVLHQMEGLSGKEIAERLGIPEATVWTRLHHARQAFRRSFKWKEKETTPGAPR